MAFRTKLDFSNRQVNQKEQSKTSLNGRTDFGLNFNDLSTGPNLSTSATTQVFENVQSTFIGNLTGTTFTFGNPIMDGSQIYLNVITPVNSNTIQMVEPHFIGVSGHTNPYFMNTVYNHYLAVEYDFTITNFVEYSPNNFSGTAISETVTQYRAESWDYDGDGVWVGVNGKIKTEKIIITNNASAGKVLACINSSGDTNWVTASGSTSLFTSGVGINSIQIIGDGTNDAAGDYSFSLGVNNKDFGNYSFGGGSNNKIGGNYSFAYGDSLATSQDYSFSLGNNNYSKGSYSYLLGSSNLTENDFNFIFGQNHYLSGATNSVILGGSGISGYTSDTVYVPFLNIRNLKGGGFTTDIGINAQGFVVEVLSDERLKENINTIESALDKVLNLRGVTYNWKDRESGEDKLRIGFIAQEVNEVVSELVFTNKDGQYLGVHYDNITALLVEAIKELVSNGEDNLITSKHVPINSNDSEGEIGDLVCDNNFMYVKTKNGWRRSALDNF